MIDLDKRTLGIIGDLTPEQEANVARYYEWHGQVIMDILSSRIMYTETYEKFRARLLSQSQSTPPKS